MLTIGVSLATIDCSITLADIVCPFCTDLEIARSVINYRRIRRINTGVHTYESFGWARVSQT